MVDARNLYFGYFIISTVLMIVLPSPFSSIAFFSLLAVSARILFCEPLRRLLSVPLPVVRPALRVTLELALILIVLYLSTSNIRNWSPEMRLSGNEFSYLVNSGTIAANVFHKSGAIPLWNPFMGMGEPLIENPFSFVLNPLMTLPIFTFGVIQGAKVGVLLHIALMGLGGWVLGYVLRLGAPGRILLGVLLGCSGSMAALIGFGFYQMGLSQAYIPWIFAGLIGTLYSEERWPIGVLVVASMLMIFAGTFWYVLPTALGCGLLVIFALIRAENAGLIFRRVLIATAFIVGLGMVRLLPQVVHHGYMDHPAANVRKEMVAFLDVIRRYFAPGKPSQLYYHYIVPPVFAALVGGLWLIFVRSRWRIMIPGLLLILGFTLWAQSGPVMVWLYDQIELLQEWRFLSRMAGAATPWIAVLVAIAFDDVVRVGRRYMPNSVSVLLAVWLLCGLAMVSAWDVAGNWNRSAGTMVNASFTRAPLHYLREQNPEGLFSLLTWRFFTDYLPFYDTFSRASFGNPDYHPRGLDSTIGPYMTFYPEYALPGDAQKVSGLRFLGYERVLTGRYTTILYHYPEMPPYAFTVRPYYFFNRESALTNEETEPVVYVHNLDSIHLTIPAERFGQILVVQETAYPGWQVRLNGESIPLESVGGLLGVRLPLDLPENSQVVFVYRPVWYFIGAAITLLTACVFVFYLLKQKSAKSG